MGGTSFGSFAGKRYRFTGKERDEENGLYYHGARYCIPWLGRCISCDPLGMVEGSNLYSYVSDSSPMNYQDLTGLKGMMDLGEGPGRPGSLILKPREGGYWIRNPVEREVIEAELLDPKYWSSDPNAEYDWKKAKEYLDRAFKILLYNLIMHNPAIAYQVIKSITCNGIVDIITKNPYWLNYPLVF